MLLKSVFLVFSQYNMNDWGFGGDSMCSNYDVSHRFILARLYKSSVKFSKHLNLKLQCRNQAT